jgi:hypothetical protein
MTDKQKKYITWVGFGIYFLIITVLIFKKPSGWSMMPYSWQQEWHPNYFLYFILLVVGIVTSIYGSKVFKGKQEVSSGSKRFCIGCGKELKTKEKFCGKCGKKNI